MEKSMKNKKYLLPFLLGSIFLLSGFLISCGDAKDETKDDNSNPEQQQEESEEQKENQTEVNKPTEYTVYFNTDGGTSIQSQILKPGAKAEKPADPERSPCTFGGWYSDNAGTKEFDFDTAINSDTTIYAKWIIPEGMYKISFNMDGGTPLRWELVKAGESFAKPVENPSREGYNFVGWFSDSEKTTDFDFASKINADTTIYAKWQLLKYKVTFNTDGGTSIDEVTVNHGEKITKPADPKKENLIFDGWYTDEDKTSKFDFNDEIKSDTTLYAKWLTKSKLLKTVSIDSLGDVFFVNYKKEGDNYIITAKEGFELYEVHLGIEDHKDHSLHTCLYSGTSNTYIFNEQQILADNKIPQRYRRGNGVYRLLVGGGDEADESNDVEWTGFTLQTNVDSGSYHAGVPVVNVSDLSEVSLKGKKDGAEKDLGSWTSIADFSAEDIEIDEGSWELTLTAKKENAIFSHSLNINVVNGQNVSVDFVLENVTPKDVKGRVEIDLTWPKVDEFKTIMVGFLKWNEKKIIEEDEEKASPIRNYWICKGPNASKVILKVDGEKLVPVFNVEGLTETSWKEVIEDLTPGVYACTCAYYLENFESLENAERVEEYTQCITIQPGLTTVIKDSLDYF